jgi:hypothetical protein
MPPEISPSKPAKSCVPDGRSRFNRCMIWGRLQPLYESSSNHATGQLPLAVNREYRVLAAGKSSPEEALSGLTEPPERR